MATITLEQVDLLMQRANVSYTEAKEALERCNGDVVEALLYLEKAEKINLPKSAASNVDKLTSLIDKLNATTFIMKKKEKVYVNVPLSVALIAIILCFHVSILAIIIAIIFGVRISIIGENDIANKINSTIDELKK
ncbi:MAG: DUF4342 domain-containing protein [Candidatus Cellulosilyticum pullistercoris]|uniref:DUF4342 domain-containing protein n=1 Tax=Candidatus Cellulosilyticum pullistercoris TaxID=2838521 RepID=A0A9E2KD31_9FIRM|nr:DUF4342 domain-containing protein [Candidatus Cellulosilyticum pullistercoris]